MACTNRKHVAAALTTRLDRIPALQAACKTHIALRTELSRVGDLVRCRVGQYGLCIYASYASECYVVLLRCSSTITVNARKLRKNSITGLLNRMLASTAEATKSSTVLGFVRAYLLFTYSRSIVSTRAMEPPNDRFAISIATDGDRDLAQLGKLAWTQGKKGIGDYPVYFVLRMTLHLTAANSPQALLLPIISTSHCRLAQGYFTS